MIKKILLIMVFIVNLLIGIYFSYPFNEKIQYNDIITLYSNEITSENSAHLIGAVDNNSIDIVLQKIKNNDIKYLLITSPGGSVDEGMKLIKIIEERRDIICIADEAMSIAFIILQACNKRFITKNTVLMHHYAYIYIDPLEKALVNNKYQLISMEKEINDFNSFIEDYMVNRINITHKDYREKMKEDWFISNEDIKNFNIIDGIYTKSISNKY